MRQDAEIVSKKAKFLPSKVVPNVIVDLGYRTRFSTESMGLSYPEAIILSGQIDNRNFLLDKNALAYHDKIIFKSVDLRNFDLDDFLAANKLNNQYIDFLNIDNSGIHRSILGAAGYWPGFIDYVRINVPNDVDYQDVKTELASYGYTAWAHFDGREFYVIGESERSIYV